MPTLNWIGKDKVITHHNDVPPDFILHTKSGKTIVIETKGDHLDNEDSAAKCRLGNEWEKQAGQDFAYFMIFDKKNVDGAYTLDKAKELIGRM